MTAVLALFPSTRRIVYFVIYPCLWAIGNMFALEFGLATCCAVTCCVACSYVRADMFNSQEQEPYCKVFWDG
jgi:hypothetical protein